MKILLGGFALAMLLVVALDCWSTKPAAHAAVTPHHWHYKVIHNYGTRWPDFYYTDTIETVFGFVRFTDSDGREVLISGDVTVEGNQ